jgi:thiol-disulfide isomerase/thioredoxin
VNLNKNILIPVISVLLFTSFFLKDFNISIKAALLAGILLGINRFEKPGIKHLTFQLILLLMISSAGILLIMKWKTLTMMIRPLLLVNFLSLLGYFIGFGINKLKIEKSFKLAFVAGLVLLFFETGSRILGEGWFAAITVAVSLSVTMYLSSQVKPRKIFVLMLIYFSPTFILNLIAWEPFGSTLVAPVIVLCFITSFFYLRKNWYELSVSMKLVRIFVLLFLSVMGWFLQENYAYVRYAALNEQIPVKASYAFLTWAGDTITSASNEDEKVVVCLFWSANCSRCKYEYPPFSDLAMKYKSNYVAFYGVYLSMSKRDSIYYTEHERPKYNFEWVKALGGRQIYDDLKIDGVPHLAIFNKKNEVVYNGWVRSRPWIWVNRPEDIINKALK